MIKVSALVAIVFLAGCGAEKGESIFEEEYGNDWPYSVSSGLLYCDEPGSNVVLKSGGYVYALNGRAMGNAKKRGYKIARDSIALKDENGYASIGDPSQIIERGVAMCGG